MEMTKTQALKAASAAVGLPNGEGTSWTVYGPYYSSADGLSGPSTSISTTSYSDAMRRRSMWVASLAMQLMMEGVDFDDDDLLGAEYRIE